MHLTIWIKIYSVFSAFLLIDLNKAFDAVNHDILLCTLQHYIIRGITHNFFLSYLKQRKQYVSINDNNSPIVDIQYGIPQGKGVGRKISGGGGGQQKNTKKDRKIALFSIKGVLNPNFRPFSFELNKKLDFLK